MRVIEVDEPPDAKARRFVMDGVHGSGFPRVFDSSRLGADPLVDELFLVLPGLETVSFISDMMTLNCSAPWTESMVSTVNDAVERLTKPKRFSILLKKVG